MALFLLELKWQVEYFHLHFSKATDLWKFLATAVKLSNHQQYAELRVEASVLNEALPVLKSKNIFKETFVSEIQDCFLQ